jgi:signal transduction histidine kinase/HD-like signal output (HDOD) protein
MPGKTADATIARQVEFAINRLDSISILPCVGARFLSELNQFQFSPQSLTELIECDPGLTARVFSLVHKEGQNFPDNNLSIRQAIDKIPLRLIRDAFFSINVYSAFEQNKERALFRSQLVLHAIATACCARKIAETVHSSVNPYLAYLAGLLHNIGNLALDQEMPRSFAQILEEAKSQEACICDVEQRHLGIDYTTLGKRLGQKWHLPVSVTMAIWLHHSNTVTVSQNMPEAKIAQVVQLADIIARQAGIGQSGSYDSAEMPEELMQSLSISSEQMDQIRENLSEQVAVKSKIAGMDLPDTTSAYCNAVHQAAAQLAKDNTTLSQENRRLQTASGHFDFTADFLLSINPDNTALDIAENFAVRWQKFYQTGLVCLYLAADATSQTFEAVVVENQSQRKTVLLNAPADSPAIPPEIANNFALLDAMGHADWLFEQLDVDFEPGKTKLIPLLSGGRTIGVLVFEFRYPTDTEKLEEKFKASALIAGSVLDMAFTAQKQQHFAEQFAQLVTSSPVAASRVSVPAPPKNQPVITDAALPAAGNMVTALAEMAAGAAHELNNPLLVISGRAQLLGQSETDPEKKRMLKQIQDNTTEITSIIDELMSFANPVPPRPAQTDINQILEEAVELASQKANIEHINAQMEFADDLPPNLFVDSAQIVSAIANIITNSVESYTGDLGPIKITAQPEQSGNFVKLQIADLGCGMDEKTIRKATYPFFSGKPAGRKRGMGLAHAARFIQLNKGMLDITSKPGGGTTVTILLPAHN